MYFVRIPVIVGSDSGTNVGRHFGSSWAVRRGLMLANDYLLFDSLAVKVFSRLRNDSPLSSSR
jgi:hypothetical protein